MEKLDIKKLYDLIKSNLNEKQRRLYLGAAAKVFGRGGVSKVSQETGVSRKAISAGVKELEEKNSNNSTEKYRIRKEGGGRKKTIDTDPTLKSDLLSLVEPITRGDPESPLLWVCKSVRKLSTVLNNKGHKTSHRMVAELLQELGFSLQANKKTIEGGTHPDRNQQFEFINNKAKAFQGLNQPVISVDTKKKELVGNFKNVGKEIRPLKNPEEVKVYDFVDPELGKANPYGIYDMSNNTGWVNVGINKDTAEFAVESIRRWWNSMGKTTYPNAKNLMITADGGGSNGSRVRLWKYELQKLSNEIEIPITVCHFPPGTSKWNKIEHKLFSFISQNWRGKPLISLQVIISLIAATTTESGGLKVKCSLDENIYETGKKISNEQMEQLKIIREEFHGEWNYTISPSK
jgi:hypothetical protein